MHLPVFPRYSVKHVGVEQKVNMHQPAENVLWCVRTYRLVLTRAAPGIAAVPVPGELSDS